jgi:dUTP pyrophosphatase
MKLNQKALIPTRSHPTDAGLDLYCQENTSYKPGDLVKVPTGIAIEIPKGYVGLIRDRSSVSLQKLKVTAGVIDCGYTGEVNVVLLNLAEGKDGHGCVQRGQKIAQILLVPVETPEVEVVEDFAPTEAGRKEQGFGSTGAFHLDPFANE